MSKSSNDRQFVMHCPNLFNVANLIHIVKTLSMQACYCFTYTSCILNFVNPLWGSLIAELTYYMYYIYIHKNMQYYSDLSLLRNIPIYWCTCVCVNMISYKLLLIAELIVMHVNFVSLTCYIFEMWTVLLLWTICHWLLNFQNIKNIFFLI